MRKKAIAVTLCLFLVACTTDQILADIQVLIQIATAILPVVTNLDHLDSAEQAEITKLSSIAVNGIAAIATDYQAYKKSGAITDLQKLQAAIGAIQWNLKQELAAAQIKDPVTIAKVTAWVNLIVTTLDAIRAQLPSLQFRPLTSTIMLPTPAVLKARWDSEVCNGEATCSARVKTPRGKF